MFSSYALNTRIQLKPVTNTRWLVLGSTNQNEKKNLKIKLLKLQLAILYNFTV